VNDLEQLLSRIGWTVPELARRVGRSPPAVYPWVSGVNSRGNPCCAPVEVTDWLRRVVRAVEREEPPARFRPKGGK